MCTLTWRHYDNIPRYTLALPALLNQNQPRKLNTLATHREPWPRAIAYTDITSPAVHPDLISETTANRTSYQNVLFAALLAVARTFNLRQHYRAPAKQNRLGKEAVHTSCHVKKSGLPGEWWTDFLFLKPLTLFNLKWFAFQFHSTNEVNDLNGNRIFDTM